jgi:UDP-N-acetylglucosamine--N-acetylmuramyl-(pentapeptide) pyrophosphoryl-undecaprenol N-acetylglucosamine transferase
VKPCKIIISGGGTGGHIYPALAIATELQRQSWVEALLFVGALGRMEMELIPKAGFPIKGLWIDGIQRKWSVRNLVFPFKLVFSMVHALLLLVRFQPKVVIGTGGFASGPLVFMASLLKIPTLIQEQNSYPGITNKLLGKRADKVAVAYDGMERFFIKSKIVYTGNPIRNSINSGGIAPAKAKAFFNLNPEQKTLVVLGGSLGAKKINALIAQNHSYFKKYNCFGSVVSCTMNSIVR